ncbi:MAG: hypothetical protein B6I35_07605 [Anaerolineaceae bacterium 4572_32.2]|nr:MAG: hypothetical protein B6I35_07605 [Anaerolineaceae bacterium 4572_32.2]HEY72779.1 hypothetical protein [Thermoflexia bacterium]
MSRTVLVHILGEESVVGEVENIPDPTDQVLIISNLRYRDGRDVTYVLPETKTVVYPWTRIHCVEILPTEDAEDVISFIRE